MSSYMPRIHHALSIICIFICSMQFKNMHLTFIILDTENRFVTSEQLEFDTRISFTLRHAVMKSKHYTLKEHEMLCHQFEIELMDRTASINLILDPLYDYGNYIHKYHRLNSLRSHYNPEISSS